MADLARYRAKRDFSRTAEPEGELGNPASGRAGGIFVVHKHAARRLHYDLRLEHDGVLWSWAVTRGPSLDPQEKRLAVHVEDHPLAYAGFEGEIPQGSYGAGEVILWDEGRWTPEGDPAAGLAKGHLSFILEGHKLAGQWHLVRLKPRRGESRDNWLLIKVDDAAARPGSDILDEAPASVRTGRSVEDLRAAKATAGRGKAGKAGKAGALPKTGAGARAAAAALPRFVEPCLARLQTRPPAGEDWLHEVKFDGYRLQARIAAGKVRLLTRSGIDWTDRFGPTIAAAITALPCDAALIDGEVVALGPDGISSFSALQEALSNGETAGLVYFAFDLLHLDATDLRAEPLIARKERLQELLAAAPEDGALRFSEHFAESGQTMLRHACRMGLEGVISKRADAPYRSGRGRDWVKSKCTQRQEFIIAGYVPSSGSRHELGSIVAAYVEDGELRPAGRVGTGFSRKSAAALKAELDRIRTDRSPFQGAAGRERGIVWVEPTRVAEVAFRSWTAAKTLRHASFVGLRDDKPAAEIVAEWPLKASARKARKRAEPPPPEARAKASATTGIRLTNPDKLLWPDVGLSKQGLLDYYASVWPLMAPHVVGRPLSLLRAPNGIEGHSFFQKHAGPGLPEAIARSRDVDGEDLLFLRDFDGLAALVQLGTVEIHIWGSRIDAIEQPDQLILDLDPDAGLGLEAVRDAAGEVRRRLDELGFASMLKTSGGKGYHVIVPLVPAADWTVAKRFARDFARALEQSDPKRYTATLSKRARRGRIFVDYLRNGRGATAIAPYSTRARPGAPIACPIDWSALERTAPNAVHAADAASLPAIPDDWRDFFKTSQRLPPRDAAEED